MATIDLRVGGTSALNYTDSLGRSFVLTKEVDFSDLADGDGAANADVIQLFNIPAGTLVQHVVAITKTAEGGAGTLTVGDADDVDGYIASVNANSEGSYTSALTLADGTPNTVVGYTAGKFYSADGVISAVAGAALDGAVITFHVLCHNLNA